MRVSSFVVQLWRVNGCGQEVLAAHTRAINEKIESTCPPKPGARRDIFAHYSADIDETGPNGSQEAIRSLHSEHINRMQQIYFEAVGKSNVFDHLILFHDNEERAQLMKKFAEVFRFSRLLQPSKFLRPPPICDIKNYMGAKCAFYFAFMHLYTKFLYVMAPLSLFQLIMQAVPQSERGDRFLGLESIISPFMAVAIMVAATSFLEVVLFSAPPLLSLSLHHRPNHPLARAPSPTLSKSSDPRPPTRTFAQAHAPAHLRRLLTERVRQVCRNLSSS